MQKQTDTEKANTAVRLNRLSLTSKAAWPRKYKCVHTHTPSLFDFMSNFIFKTYKKIFKKLAWNDIFLVIDFQRICDLDYINFQETCLESN